jgi:beta-aspartyl-peptidase (threonine type)
LPQALLVHGGAWNIPDELVEPSLSGLRTALIAGRLRLDEGAHALDIVESVVRSLEDDPSFDAGRGSRLNRAGEVEMDASIMRGSDLDAGAVAAVGGIRHPVTLARLVMERSPHVLLVAAGAEHFADEQGVERCATEDLLVGSELERYRRVRAGESVLIREEFSPEGHGNEPEGPLGTVGAVAVDARGRMAAATSTGGTQDRLPGRVGDSPVLGAGTWADDATGAASATGWGEGILRVLLTRTVVDLIEHGSSAGDAARDGLARLDRIGGKGGVIVADRHGQRGFAFNTPRMARGWLDVDGTIHVAIEAAEAPR